MSNTDATVSSSSRKFKKAGPALLAGWIALMPVFGAAGAEFATPESAIVGYIDGVAAHDFGRILAATAVEPMSTNFNFEEFVDRYQMLAVVTPVPASDPMLVSINRATFVAQIARQLHFLTYGLLSTSSFDLGRPLPMDRTGAAVFANQINPARLEALTIEDIRTIELPAAKQARYLASVAAQALTYGADEQVERGVVLNFEGARYLIGFTLLRYGDDWGISSQSSDLMGADTLGSPERITQ